MAIILRIAGQVTGIFLTGPFLLLRFLEGGSGPGLTASSVSLYVCIAGLVLGLFKPLPGGLLALLGIAAFYLIDYHGCGRWPGGWVLAGWSAAGAGFTPDETKRTAGLRDECRPTGRCPSPPTRKPVSFSRQTASLARFVHMDEAEETNIFFSFPQTVLRLYPP